MNKQLSIYQAPNGAIEINIDLKQETVWLPLQHIADLFGVNKSSISRHIRNIFSSDELLPDGVVAIFATTIFLI